MPANCRTILLASITDFIRARQIMWPAEQLLCGWSERGEDYFSDLRVSLSLNSLVDWFAIIALKMSFTDPWPWRFCSFQYWPWRFCSFQCWALKLLATISKFTPPTVSRWLHAHAQSELKLLKRTNWRYKMKFYLFKYAETTKILTG